MSYEHNHLGGPLSRLNLCRYRLSSVAEQFSVLTAFCSLTIVLNG